MRAGNEEAQSEVERSRDSDYTFGENRRGSFHVRVEDLCRGVVRCRTSSPRKSLQERAVARVVRRVMTDAAHLRARQRLRGRATGHTCARRHLGPVRFSVVLLFVLSCAVVGRLSPSPANLSRGALDREIGPRLEYTEDESARTSTTVARCAPARRPPTMCD